MSPLYFFEFRHLPTKKKYNVLKGMKIVCPTIDTDQTKYYVLNNRFWLKSNFTYPRSMNCYLKYTLTAANVHPIYFMELGIHYQFRPKMPIPIIIC